MYVCMYVCTYVTKEVEFQCVVCHGVPVVGLIFICSLDTVGVTVGVHLPSHLLSTPSLPSPVDDDKVTFSFYRSKLSNNGTDMSGGQLPSLFYCLGTEKDVLASRTSKEKESPEVSEDYLVGISKRFSLKVTQVSQSVVVSRCVIVYIVCTD